MIHESAVWSDVHKRWFFLPRRCSTEVYSEKKDEHMGCSVLISTDSNVFDVQMVRVSEKNKNKTLFSPLIKSSL